ncbi:hypothetical protein GEMRC1_008058 [Eukaryota sp. GEM-RC1]
MSLDVYVSKLNSKDSSAKRTGYFSEICDLLSVEANRHKLDSYTLSSAPLNWQVVIEQLATFLTSISKTESKLLQVNSKFAKDLFPILLDNSLRFLNSLDLLLALGERFTFPSVQSVYLSLYADLFSCKDFAHFFFKYQVYETYVLPLIDDLLVSFNSTTGQSSSFIKLVTRFLMAETAPHELALCKFKYLTTIWNSITAHHLEILKLFDCCFEKLSNLRPHKLFEPSLFVFFPFFIECFRNCNSPGVIEVLCKIITSILNSLNHSNLIDCDELKCFLFSLQRSLLFKLGNGTDRRTVFQSSFPHLLATCCSLMGLVKQEPVPSRKRTSSQKSPHNTSQINTQMNFVIEVVDLLNDSSVIPDKKRDILTFLQIFHSQFYSPSVSVPSLIPSLVGNGSNSGLISYVVIALSSILDATTTPSFSEQNYNEIFLLIKDNLFKNYALTGIFLSLLTSLLKKYPFTEGFAFLHSSIFEFLTFFETTPNDVSNHLDGFLSSLNLILKRFRFNSSDENLRLTVLKFCCNLGLNDLKISTLPELAHTVSSLCISKLNREDEVLIDYVTNSHLIDCRDFLCHHVKHLFDTVESIPLNDCCRLLLVVLLEHDQLLSLGAINYHFSQLILKLVEFVLNNFTDVYSEMNGIMSFLPNNFNLSKNLASDVLGSFSSSYEAFLEKICNQSFSIDVLELAINFNFKIFGQISILPELGTLITHGNEIINFMLDNSFSSSYLCSIFNAITTQKLYQQFPCQIVEMLCQLCRKKSIYMKLRSISLSLTRVFSSCFTVLSQNCHLEDNLNCLTVLFHFIFEEDFLTSIQDYVSAESLTFHSILFEFLISLSHKQLSQFHLNNDQLIRLFQFVQVYQTITDISPDVFPKLIDCICSALSCAAALLSNKVNPLINLFLGTTCELLSPWFESLEFTVDNLFNFSIIVDFLSTALTETPWFSMFVRPFVKFLVFLSRFKASVGDILSILVLLVNFKVINWETIDLICKDTAGCCFSDLLILNSGEIASSWFSFNQDPCELLDSFASDVPPNVKLTFTSDLLSQSFLNDISPSPNLGDVLNQDIDCSFVKLLPLPGIAQIYSNLAVSAFF